MLNSYIIVTWHSQAVSMQAISPQVSLHLSMTSSLYCSMITAHLKALFIYLIPTEKGMIPLTMDQTVCASETMSVLGSA